MKRVIIIGMLSIATIIAVIVLSTRDSYFFNDPNDFPEIVDRKPLRMLGNETNAKYILVRTYGDKIDYVDKFSLLSENKDNFIVTNSKICYFTTVSGEFALYKDGKKIDSELFGEDSETIRINYGTLEQAFKPISEEDLKRLLDK